MAGSINKVILIGRLGKDPEMRYTPANKAVTNFTVATSENWTDQGGEKQEKTEWHRIVAWGKLAENCAKLLSRGKLVYIEGRLQTRQWDDRDGNKKYTTEIVANVMQILSPIEDGQQGTDYQRPDYQEGEEGRKGTPEEFSDVPFN